MQYKRELHSLRMEGDYPAYEARLRFLLGQITIAGEKISDLDKVLYLVINTTDPLWSGVRREAETKEWPDALRLLRAWSESLSSDAVRVAPIAAASSPDRRR